MGVVGVLLGIVGFAGLIFGLLQKRKGGKLGSVPFHPPSKIVQMGPAAADPKGMVSTEGQVMLSNQPLVAPMSGKPCIAYEIEIVQDYEYYEQTDQGVQTRSKSESAMKEYKGSVFQVGDGAGGIFVDAMKMPDISMTQSFRHRHDIGMMIPGQLHFGQGVFNTPMMTTEGPVKAFVGIEKIIEPSNTMFVVGQIGQGAMGPTIAEPKGMMSGKLLLFPKGREALMGATARNAKIGLIAGGVFMLVGTILGIVGAVTGSDSDDTSGAASSAQVAPPQAAQPMQQPMQQPMAPPVMQPAGDPNQLPPGAPTPRSQTCRRAMLCCMAANTVNPAGCYTLATVPDIACRANIPAYRNLVQRLNPTAIAACNLP
ncbi:MAG: GIDE domain-containing protein [Deltaproteobacteria bacterium]|nr:GIDE domain-containing protein [Deltaproteobacteria bacterium]